MWELRENGQLNPQKLPQIKVGRLENVEKDRFVHRLQTSKVGWGSEKEPNGLE